jgi:hypothetical protein
MGASAKRRGSLGSFRQKWLAVEAKNRVSEMLEGFWGESGGFVWVLRDIAMATKFAGVLRDWKREDLKT